VNWKGIGRAPLWRLSRWAGTLAGGGLGAWLGWAVLGDASRLLAFGLAGLFAVAGLVPLLRRQEAGCLTAGLGAASLLAVVLIPQAAWPLGAALLLGALGGWLGGKSLRGLLGKLLLGRGGRTLKQTRKLVRRRIRELRARLRRLRGLQREVPGAPAGGLSAAAAEALVEGEARLHEQVARYRAQDWRTDYARWRNEVVALAEDADARAVDTGTIGELKLLDESGRRLLDELRRDAEALATEEGGDGHDRLAETLRALENLRQQVLLQVAVTEASALPSADSTSYDAASSEPRIFEALHGETEDAQLFADLAKLEAEHARLSDDLDRGAAPARPRPRARD
jgi:hypothetical protein